jgi:hypothetical protein
MVDVISHMEKTTSEKTRRRRKQQISDADGQRCGERCD